MKIGGKLLFSWTRITHTKTTISPRTVAVIINMTTLPSTYGHEKSPFYLVWPDTMPINNQRQRRPSNGWGTVQPVGIVACHSAMMMMASQGGTRPSVVRSHGNSTMLKEKTRWVGGSECLGARKKSETRLSNRIFQIIIFSPPKRHCIIARLIRSSVTVHPHQLRPPRDKRKQEEEKKKKNQSQNKGSSCSQCPLSQWISSFSVHALLYSFLGLDWIRLDYLLPSRLMRQWICGLGLPLDS